MRRPRLAFYPLVALVGILSVGASAGVAQAGQVTGARATAQHAQLNGFSATLRIPPGPKPPRRGRLEFVAHFHGTRLKTTVWDTCYPFMSQSGCQNFGNKDEAEWYMPSQVRVYGGNLHLIASRRRTVGRAANGSRKVYDCRSGMITSHPMLRFKYGFLQITAKIPHGRGLWPALWLAPANETGLPEVDILESWGLERTADAYYHPYPQSARSDRGKYPVRWTKGWQTYTLSWKSSRMKFYVGTHLVLTVRRRVPHLAMYFLADVAEFQRPRGKGYCYGQMEIHSVKLWSWRRPATAPKIPPGPRHPRRKPEFVATFSGKRLDTKIWDTCFPYASQSGCTNFANKEEAEWYKPGQVRVYDGILHLVASREKTEGSNVDGKPKLYDCRSGMVASYPSLRFKYGFLQVTANIPHRLGLWPALWLLPANETRLPEVGVLESWGVNVKAGSFFRPYPKGSRTDRRLVPVRWTRGWQTYSLSWTYSRMKFYIGKRLVLTVTRKVPHSAMYFIANLAEYKPPGKGYCTGQMEIHSVKVWKN